MSALATLAAAELELIRAAPPPRGTDAMRAVLTDERFSDADWVFERKLDGIRCVAVRDGERVRLLSRNDLPLDERYPEIAAAVAALAEPRFALDGEVVALDGSQTSFELLAQRGRRRVRVYYYVFDVLWIDGRDLRALPLLVRKRVLRGIGLQEPLRMTPYRRERGEELYAEACRKGWEGLIAKRADSAYASSRSRDWLKFKCGQGQELVIGGFTAPQGSRTDFGALLLGHYAGGELRYAGKVGTGFDAATLADLGRRLRSLRRADSPFAASDARAIRERDVTWVEPELVGQIGFSEWTRDGRLRHPRFLGLRDDKPARKVVRERP
jgi:DNA ligase D-like protein (predicted ligase)